MIEYFERLLKGFKSGETEKIFICIYSYFVVGYLILFTTYGQNFIVLQFSTQILLSIGISFPITTFSILLMSRNRTDKDKTLGLFYQHQVELILTSMMFSTFFSLVYIIKILNPYNALFIILLCVIVFYIVGISKK